MAKKPMCKTAMRSIIADQIEGVCRLSKTGMIKLFREVNLDYPINDESLNTRNILSYNKDGKRTRARIGRFISNHCDPHSDTCHSIERLKAKIYPVQVNIKELRGDDIMVAYWEGEAYEACTSCMTGDYHDFSNDYENIVELYAQTPEKISLVIAEYCGRTARALLWRHSDGGNKTFLDRIYSRNQGVKDALFEWAQNNCDYCRTPHDEYLNCKTGKTFNPRDFKLTYTVNNPPQMWPYMDTFSYASVGSQTSMLFRNIKCGPSYDGEVSRLDSCSGSRCEVTVHCKKCDKHYYDVSFKRVAGHSNVCHDCYNSLTTECSHCRVRILTDDAIDGYCSKCDTLLNTKCDECGRPARECEQQELIVGGDTFNICRDCKQSKYADYNQCVECKEHFKSKYDVILTDNQAICRGCAAARLCFRCGTYTKQYTLVNSVELCECLDCYQTKAKGVASERRRIATLMEQK